MSDIMNGFAGGALGTVGNFVSTLIANDANKELVRERNQMAIDQWNRENAYNSPRAMVKRLRDAGLNPAMMYENGAGSLSASSSPEMQSARVNAPQVDPLTMAQIANLDSQTNKNNADAIKTGLEADNQKIKNFIDNFNKSILENNEFDIREMAESAVRAGTAKSSAEYYESLYSAVLLAHMFEDISEDQSGQRKFVNVGNLELPADVLKKFDGLGLNRISRENLEYGLYKSYVSAQQKVNKRVGEQADMETVIPEMINNAPDWLRPILVLGYQWLNSAKFPSFSFGTKVVKKANSD